MASSNKMKLQEGSELDSWLMSASGLAGDVSALADHDPWDKFQVPGDVLDLMSDGVEFGLPDTLRSEPPVQPGPGASTGNTPRKRPYQPRTGDARARNKETQRRYRQRQKERAAEAEAALAATAAELRAAKVEQVAFREQNRALEMLCRYSEGALTLLRSAASAAAALPAAAASAALSLYRDVVDLLWCHGLRPSDSQLRLLARHMDRLPPTFNAFFVGRMVNAIEQWHRSPPAGRQAVERKLATVFETRSRVMAIVFNEFPEKAGSMMRNGPDAAELREAIANAASLRAPDVLEAVELTEEQAATLQRLWEGYVARYRAARGLQAEAAGLVDACLVEPASLRDVVALQAQGAHGGAAAAAFLAEERAARLELFEAVQRTLRPLQISWLQLVAVRALLTADVVHVIRFVVSHLGRSPALSPAELLTAAEAAGGGRAAIKEGGA